VLVSAFTSRQKPRMTPFWHAATDTSHGACAPSLSPTVRSTTGRGSAGKLQCCQRVSSLQRGPVLSVGEEYCAEQKTRKVSYYPPLLTHEYDRLRVYVTLLPPFYNL